MAESLFNLAPLDQTAPQLPAQPQVGNQPAPGQPVLLTGTGTPSAPVTYERGRAVGFFTDTTLCIGCKACEVACKECVQAGCLEVCPTGAITRTEFDTVYIQQDVCNGCRYCVAGCPFGVIEMNDKGVAGKCTFCYDRLEAGLTPACAQACPTASIQFGPIEQLQQHADQRLAQLQSMGRQQARLYGREESMLGRLNAFFLLEDVPSVYGLPEAPKLPS